MIGKQRTIICRKFNVLTPQTKIVRRTEGDKT